MRQARWNLTGFPIRINRSQQVLTLFNFNFCFHNAITSFQSYQNAQSFFRVLICFEKLIVKRKGEKILKSDDCWNTARGNLSNSHVPEA